MGKNVWENDGINGKKKMGQSLQGNKKIMGKNVWENPYRKM